MLCSFAIIAKLERSSSIQNCITMSTGRRMKRPRVADFERPLHAKRIKLSWPNKLVQSIPIHLEQAIRNSRSARFLRHTVNLLNAQGTDTSWTAHRFLGAGSYGNVALWVQRNEDGEIQDEVGIKEEVYNTADTAFNPDDNKPDPYFSREAQTQSTVNENAASSES